MKTDYISFQAHSKCEQEEVQQSVLQGYKEGDMQEKFNSKTVTYLKVVVLGNYWSSFVIQVEARVPGDNQLVQRKQRFKPRTFLQQGDSINICATLQAPTVDSYCINRKEFCLENLMGVQSRTGSKTIPAIHVKGILEMFLHCTAPLFTQKNCWYLNSLLATHGTVCDGA